MSYRVLADSRYVWCCSERHCHEGLGDLHRYVHAGPVWGYAAAPGRWWLPWTWGHRTFREALLRAEEWVREYDTRQALIREAEADRKAIESLLDP